MTCLCHQKAYFCIAVLFGYGIESETGVAGDRCIDIGWFLGWLSLVR